MTGLILIPLLTTGETCMYVCIYIETKLGTIRRVLGPLTTSPQTQEA